MYLRLLVLVLAINSMILTGCIPEFSTEAERLGSLDDHEMKEEFKRLGTLPEAPGPIPVGQSEGLSGLFMLDHGVIPWINQFQQDIAYSMVWAGKVFHIDGSVPCNPEKGGSFWLENRLKTVFKAIWLLEGGGKGLVYYSNDSWIGDGNKTIQINYAPTPALAFVHDEIRLAKWDHETDMGTYLGIMWVQIGPVRWAFAYFIPDQVTPFPCE